MKDQEARSRALAEAADIVANPQNEPATKQLERLENLEKKFLRTVDTSIVAPAAAPLDIIATSEREFESETDVARLTTTPTQPHVDNKGNEARALVLGEQGKVNYPSNQHQRGGNEDKGNDNGEAEEEPTKEGTYPLTLVDFRRLSACLTDIVFGCL